VTRPLVLIDLSPADVALIVDRLLVIAERERLGHADVAALAGVSRSVVKQLLSVTHRASDETLRCVIAAFPEVATGMTVTIIRR